MASSCLQEFPRASGSGDDGGPARKEPESFCCQLVTSTPITHPEEFAKLLDLIVNQSKEEDPAAGIVFAFLNFPKSNCLFPLACLVHFFETFVPQPIITYLTSDSCLSAAKSIDTILMEAEKSEQGLYKDTKRSCFPSTGRNHFLRLMNASGPIPKGEKSAAGATRRGLPELDYILFQEDLPSYFDRSERYDSLPGDPVNYLFSALPQIQEDDAGFKGSNKSADYNRRFALALWPYANSSIEDIIAKSDDKAASDLWWAGRFAFSLWDRSDLSIRCSFTQLLGEIALYHNSEIVDNPAPVKPNHLCEAVDGGPCPGEAYVQKHKWLKYARWIHRGRKDEDADIKVRLGSKCDLNELLSIEKCVTCGHERKISRCGAKKPMHHCSGCYVEWFPHLRRTYCGPKCQKKDWKTHFEECQRHKHFIRAVWILKGIADKFMAATFSGQAVDISPIEVRDNKTKALDLNSVPRFAVTPAACAVGPWVGEQVFPLGKSYLADKRNEDRARALAWDAGDNLYYHLQTIIRQIVSPLCDDVVEMQMFLRNANSITSLAADRCREGPAINTAKGKDPMFWPHPVLNCRLKGSDDLFIIDLLGAKFGFNEILLPGEVWVKSRLAYCVGSTVVTDMTPHWFPREQQGLVSCRDEVAYTWRSCIKTYIAAKWPNVPGPFALSHLKEQLFRERTYMFMVHSDDIFREATTRLREERLFRQYLVHDPNPYSHEFAIGVTNCQKECDVYEKIWMDRRVFDVIVKGELSEQNQLLPAGSETIRLVALWVDRLIKHGQKVKFDSVGLLGPRMAKHYNICTTHSLDELREISTPWLLWHGISKGSSQKFFEQCKGIVTDYINSNAATPNQLLSKMASSDGLAKYLQTLSVEDAQEFLEIGSMIESPHNAASIKQLRKELEEQAGDKK
ncbi:MYND finger [Colletotrichum abscissum]|uniref:MYND finger n=1 Tax=Colletotrichum abscissum TaxID=1671311 RepID=A0A9Q0BA34_9PEZI|nr:MYND finger [Colletotrichum abscissum]KAI3558047.1 MYND finger [Colletotrichum abscissum]KAK1482869.1 MYND finger [Colletotrichum abscissum]